MCEGAGDNTRSLSGVKRRMPRLVRSKSPASDKCGRAQPTGIENRDSPLGIVSCRSSAARPSETATRSRSSAIGNSSRSLGAIRQSSIKDWKSGADIGYHTIMPAPLAVEVDSHVLLSHTTQSFWRTARFRVGAGRCPQGSETRTVATSTQSSTDRSLPSEAGESGSRFLSVQSLSGAIHLVPVGPTVALRPRQGPPCLESTDPA